MKAIFLSLLCIVSDTASSQTVSLYKTVDVPPKYVFFWNTQYPDKGSLSTVIIAESFSVRQSEGGCEVLMTNADEFFTKIKDTSLPVTKNNVFENELFARSLSLPLLNGARVVFQRSVYEVDFVRGKNGVSYKGDAAFKIMKKVEK